MANLTYSNTDENKFWLQIIGDYTRLLIQAFAPDQRGEIQKARTFIEQFDSLLARAREDLTPEQLMQLNKDALAASQNIRNFFLQMLSLQVRSGYPIFIKPLIINNALTFTEEYIYLLNSFISNQMPAGVSICQLEIFWLPIFVQISKVISDSLGLYQIELRRQAEEFANRFTNLLLSVMEYQGISRIGTDQFAILQEHQEETIRTLNDFTKFIRTLINLSQQNRIPGPLSVLYLDRSIRITCYVLRQLSVLTDAKPPECDPFSPRLRNI